jgi:hypothetical protein
MVSRFSKHVVVLLASHPLAVPQVSRGAFPYNGSVALMAGDKDLSWYHQQRGFDHISLSTIMKKPVDHSKLSDR